MIRLIFVLTAICIISAGLLVATHTITQTRIERQAVKAETEALQIVIPTATSFEQKQINGFTYHTGFDQQKKPVGYAFINQGTGYSSIIKIMIGLSITNTIVGIKILSQQETPGLGDRVDEIKVQGTLWDKLKGKDIPPPKRPWFQAQFNGKSNTTIDTVDTITGATITSDAVIRIVKEGIASFNSKVLKEHKIDKGERNDT